MINYSHPFFIKIRKIGQGLGILRPFVRMFRKLFNLQYENNFDKEMMRQISQNDIVWDIGANIGYFTCKFSDIVGKDGKVFAFEPAATTYKTLQSNCNSNQNVKCINIGLSNMSGKLWFRDSGIENDPTNGLVSEGTPGATVVNILTGDDLILHAIALQPTAMKIDVEGFELDVLQGMKNILGNLALQKIFVEVHFLEMNKRGLVDAPRELNNTLLHAGFRINWTDPSHFIATRKL